MDMATLLVSTALKLGFVLAIILTFAPVIIWAERRQSAMMQDRIGPVRAGLRVPEALVPMVKNLIGAGSAVHYLLTGVFALAALLLAALATMHMREVGDFVVPGGLGDDADPWLSWNAVLWISVLMVPVNFVMGRLLGYTHHHFKGNITVIGLLHPLSDALKFMWKEDFIPPNADKLLHALAPIIVVVTAIAAFAVIPFADTLYLDYVGSVLPADGHVGGAAIPMQVADINVGVLFVFAIAGTGVVGAAIAGYSSDNKFSLLGGLRAAGQMVSYEVTLGLTIVPMFMIYNSLLLNDMVHWQADHVWGVFVNPLAFILFFTSSIAETKRVPFDVPEGESEIVGGYLTEYSGMKFGMFFMAEFVEVIVLAALATTIFFGGYDVPFLTRSGFEMFGYIAEMPHWAIIAIQMLSFVVKLVLFIWLQLQIRWTLPRFRYDQIMSLCWKYILPASLVSILITGIGVLLVGG
jgi:NADH-quinone oxidoreductase subunit H